jgi:hypothetical protein
MGRHGECIGEHFIFADDISIQQHFAGIGGSKEEERKIMANGVRNR